MRIKFLLNSTWMHIFFLSTICCLVFFNSLNNSFLLDDFGRIVNNAEIRKVQPISRFFTDPRTMSAVSSTVMYRPLLPISLSINYAISKYNVVSYHIFNIIFHLLACIFLYFLFINLLDFKKSLNNAKLISFVAVTIFAIHPISGFPVNYLCARDLLIMFCFLSAALLFYIKMRKKGDSIIGWSLVIFFFSLSLLSKSNAIAMPAVIFFFEIFVARTKLFSLKLFCRIAAFIFVIILWLVWIKFGLNFNQTANVPHWSKGLSYFKTQIVIHLFQYLKNFFWPFQIRVMPDVYNVKSFLDSKFIISSIFILATLVSGWLVRKKIPIITFCIFTYWCLLALTSSFIPLHIIARDYRIYTSLPFLTLIFSVVLIVYPKVVSSFLIVFMFVYFAVASFFMNNHFKNAGSFNLQGVKYGANCIATMNLGHYYRNKDDKLALKYFKLALKKSPNYHVGNINIGFCYIALGEKEKGINFIRKGVELAPENSKAASYNALARALHWINDSTGAYNAAKTSLTYNDYNIKYIYTAARYAQNIKKYNESAKLLDSLHEKVDNHKISRFIAAWNYHKNNKIDEAIKQYFLAMEYFPTYPQTYANLGFIYKDKNDFNKAADMFQKYLILKPSEEIKKVFNECKKNIDDEK